MTHLAMIRNSNVREVSVFGETLIVAIIGGVKALIDPCDKGTVVHVTSGRRATLVQYSTAGVRPIGRDLQTTVVETEAGLGFRILGINTFDVLLRDLPEGQKVDIPDTTHFYARLRRPVPVRWAATAAAVSYACVA